MQDPRNPRIFFHVLIAIALFLWTIQGARAQLTDTTRHLVEDGWIELMNNNISLKLSLNNDYETFKVHTEDNDIVLFPNVRTLNRLSGNYRFISFNVGFAPSFLPGNGDNDIKGKTKYFHAEAAFMLRHWFNNLSYNRVKGYYLENTRDYQAWVEGDPYLQFPDLVYNGFSYTTGWRFNPKVSLLSLTTQTERQLKSAGSFLPVLNLRYYSMNDKSTPSPGGATQKSNNFEWNLGPGYIYTFVIREKFYTSLAFTPGIGFIHTRLTTRFPSGDDVNWQHNFAFRWEGKGGIGYNARDFFTGFYIGISGVSYHQQNTTVMNYDTRIFFQGFIGLRLKAPAGLKNFMDRIENKKRGLNKNKDS